VDGRAPASDGTFEGVDFSDLNSITPGEIDANLIAGWSWRGPLYQLYANSTMYDYAPIFAKRHRSGAQLFGRPSHANIILWSSQNIHSYMMLGWETGIKNEFIALRRNGMSVEKIMELVMFSQLYAGMRGLGHVFRAVGEDLPSFGPPVEPLAVFPPGWEADPEAFKSGLDLSTAEFTEADRRNLVEWYEQTIGYVPKSVKFGLRHRPEFVKAVRAKWEVTIRTLPKQLAPYLMLRHHTITGSVDGLREAALLGKAWGMTPDLVIQAVMATAMLFTSMEGLYVANEALEDILDDWTEAG
jgi:hypothetical protein